MKYQIYIWLVISSIIISCRQSTTEMAETLKPDIEKIIQEKWNKTYEIEKFTIVQIEGNKYTGLIEGQTAKGTKRKFTVQILYDGENAKYEILPDYSD